MDVERTEEVEPASVDDRQAVATSSLEGEANRALFASLREANVYNWEQPGWPEFEWNDAALIAPLADARHRQGRLFGRMQGLASTCGWKPNSRR